MWSRWSHILYPLTVLTFPKVKFKWTDVEQEVFYEIKRTVACNTLLAYPDDNKHFNIHTDAINHKLGAGVIQEVKPIAFYSRKWTETQNIYMVTEK